MNNRPSTLDSTWTAGGAPRRQLAAVLEGYLAEMEQGAAPSEDKLLEAHPDLADELRPYLDSLRLLHGATRDLRTGRVAAADSAGEADVPARQIGDYQIVREIGRGGMGIVYEAHQKSLNRQVALKVLPFAAVLDQRQIARFRNEAQAAAQLHHPHIVPVFAVGQEQGVYYYAMQYISGQSLEQAIAGLKDSHTAAPRRDEPTGPQSKDTRPIAAVSTLRTERSSDFFRSVARLGKEAADALAHAHEYGIIHRDIKPSNLLVDDEGKLWVTDFGLARMQTGSGVTLTGDVVGTLRYMSPEQASGQSALVDARTDVYSLGVTLYELLTQRPAFAGDDRQAVTRRIISEEPLAPRRLNPAVPIDLETIVLSAMAKGRDERYLSARALADDLDRFLNGKPTLARRPTLADRAAKWARRHRPLVLVGACALVALSVISAIGMALLAREQAATSAALAQAKDNAVAAHESFARAERHFQQARGVVDRFGMRLADRLLELPGSESIRREVLLDTLGYYRQFVAEAGDDPQLRHELALAHFKSGVIAAKLGAAADAIKEYQSAQELFRALAATDGSAAESLAQLAVTHNNLGLLLAGRGDVEAARAQYAAAIDIQQRLARGHAADQSFAGPLAESQANYGMLLDQIGDAAGAERLLRAAVDVLRPLIDLPAGEPKHAHHLAIVYNNLSFVLRKRDMDAAEDAGQQAIALLSPLVSRNPGDLQYQDDLALCFNNLAALASQEQRTAKAIELHGKAIDLQEQLARKAPAVVRHRSDLAISLNNLGVAHCRAGATDEDASDAAAKADSAFQRARKLFATLAADYPDEVAYQSSLASLLNNQALALAEAGRHDEALSIYPTAIQSQRICWQKRNDSPLMREVLSKMYYNYGQSLRTAGRFDEATQAAMARREVWKGNGERLLGVAAEIAATIEALDSEVNSGEANSGESASQDARQRWNEEVFATLRMARESGWPPQINIAADERFAPLHSNKQFAAWIDEASGPKPSAPTNEERSTPNKAD